MASAYYVYKRPQHPSRGFHPWLPDTRWGVLSL